MNPEIKRHLEERHLKPYRVLFVAQPTVEHPRFFEWQWVGIGVWLLADSPENAAEHATAIMEQLPYELDLERVCVQTPKDESLLKPRARECFEMVHLFGSAVEYCIAPPGTDKADFTGEAESLEEGEEWKKGES